MDKPGAQKALAHKTDGNGHGLDEAPGESDCAGELRFLWDLSYKKIAFLAGHASLVHFLRTGI